MEKSKKLKPVNGVSLLPEAMIQHIQSFLCRKEAARTTLLSKSWYNAWLTRPILDFNAYDFTKPSGFAEFATKSMQRYQDSSLKIDQLRLRSLSYSKTIQPLANKLVVKAMKLGATELNLELLSNKYILPREVLESETLVRLCLRGRAIGGNVGCWRLKSLVLHSVHLRNNDVLRDIISCCKLIEELSVSDCTNCKTNRFDMSGVHLHELRMLRHLCLKRVAVDPLFFSDFASRFPCLKELIRIADCSGHDSWIKIRSTSLERISIVGQVLTVELDVPNLVHFDFAGVGLPSLCIESSREWELDLSIKLNLPIHTCAWFLKLKKWLTQLRPSKISLSLTAGKCGSGRRVDDDEEGEIEVEPKPLVVENVTINTPPYTWRYTYTIVTPLANLFGICRPNFLHVDWPTDELLKILDENMVGQIGLKEVCVQVYDEILAEWQPLLSLDDHLIREKFRFPRENIRLQLRWG